MSINDLTAMQKEVDRIKKRLTNKARQKGIWEYFGQKEARYLNDKYDMLDTDHANILIEFEEWTEDFNLSDL